MRAVAVKHAKSVGGWGSTPDPAGGAHDAPPDPLVGWEGGHPSPHPTPSEPRFSRLRSLFDAPTALPRCIRHLDRNHNSF